MEADGLLNLPHRPQSLCPPIGNPQSLHSSALCLTNSDQIGKKKRERNPRPPPLHVPMHPNHDTLELLAGNRLTEPALATAEEHLLVCDSCRERLNLISEYLSTMRAALRPSDPRVILWQLHSTHDGPIQIWVEQKPDGKWLSRRAGPNLDGGLETEKRTDALLDAFQSFVQLFPEHKCSRACIVRPV